MKLLTIAFVACMAAVALADEKYTTKYDNIDVDEILRSDRLLNNYFKCLIETGKCTPDARELKQVLPDALKTGCSKCSDAQRKNADKVIKYLIENKPNEWKQLQAKYDPEGIYMKKYQADAERLGVKLN